jgi:hypothetical protein
MIERMLFMPWSKQDYPVSMKNLSSNIRNKAIEIANALLNEGYEEGRAIAIATDRAEKMNYGEVNDRLHYKITRHEKGWQLIKENGGRAILVESTKQKLLDAAKKYVNEHEGILTIYTEKDKVEERLYE